MTTTTEVTQADRLAAKELISHIRGYGVDLPYDGHFATQAFARHRAQALAQGRLEGVKAGLEAAAKEAEDFWGVDIAAPRIRALNSTTIVNQIGEK